MGVDSLKTNGPLYVAYPPVIKDAVAGAAYSWAEFCKLPESVKTAFKFVPDQHGDGAGFELRKGQEGNLQQDVKETFHITMDQYPRLAGIADNRVFAFLKGAKTLLDAIAPLLWDVASKVEETYAIQGFARAVIEAKPYWTLRYLHYFPGKNEGAVVALPHLDKGSLTLHLFETNEGLEYLDLKDRQWKRMVFGEGQTAIIAAAQLQNHSKGELTALCHRVVATEETVKKGRISVVCFITLQNIPMYNKDVYNSMQTREVGFNYGLPHKDYTKFFATNQTVQAQLAEKTA